MKRERPAISDKEVRLIGKDGEQIGIVPISKAFDVAKEAGLDLVVVAEGVTPPVCRVLDFGKLVYGQKRKLKNQKKTHTAQKTKEIRFHINIDEHDYKYKMNHAVEFLQKGHKVKISLLFRGRETTQKSMGFEIIEKTLKELEAHGKADGAPAFSGRAIIVNVNPTK